MCVTPLGLENGQITDKAIVSSSQHNIYYGPERARLRKVTQGNYIGGWSPKSSNIGEWIQFDLGKDTKVTRIAIQGRDNDNWWTTRYSLSFRVNGGSYESYNNGQVFAIAECTCCPLLIMILFNQYLPTCTARCRFDTCHGKKQCHLI